MGRRPILGADYVNGIPDSTVVVMCVCEFDEIFRLFDHQIFNIKERNYLFNGVITAEVI